VYETIVRAAREQGLAGATALRAIEGFGAGGRIHSVKVLHLSEDVPIVVEIIDTPERIAAFIPTLDKIVAEGIVTVEKIHTLTYRRNDAGATPTSTGYDIPLDNDSIQRSNLPVSESNDRVREIMDAAKKRQQVRDASTLIASICCWPYCANQRDRFESTRTWASIAESSNEHFGKRSAATKRRPFLKALEAKAGLRNGSTQSRRHRTPSSPLCQLAERCHRYSHRSAPPIRKEVLKILTAEDWQGWLPTIRM
jgi:PII-like signaling protein